MLIADESDKLLMIPGPTPVDHEILEALATQTISHTSAAIVPIVRDCLAGLQKVAGTDRGTPFVFSGSGTLAQEAAIINLVQPGEKLLVVSNGFFGDRFSAIAKPYGIEVEELRSRWGESITAAQLETRLSQGDFRAVTFTQVDTSTGALAPVAELAAVARAAGALVIVDAVCALGGTPAEMDERGIDILLSGAQKALGVPPGLTILLLSPEALNRRRSLARIPSYYADVLNWEASMADPKLYFSTHAVNLFYGLRAAMKIIEREGLDERFTRHDRLARAFRAGMSALGFSSLTADPYLASTLSVLAYPAGVDDEGFRAELSRQGVVAAGCLGEFKGRGVRFGHMGNITETEILRGLSAVESALQELGAPLDAGSGVSAARRELAGVRSIAHAR